MARTLLIRLVAGAVLLAACGPGGDDDSGPAFPSPAPTQAATATNAPSVDPPASSTTPSTASSIGPATGPATSSPAPPPDLAAVAIQLEELPVDVSEPVALVPRSGHGDALYVAEKGGTVASVALAGGETTVVLDMTELTNSSGEQGLLGIAFSPDGSRLYTSYTDNGGDSHIDEYAMAADGAADPASRREVLTLDQPYPNHNGGDIVFGPDGYLYAGYGDGGSGGDPQRRGLDPETLLGKLLRIDPAAADGQPYSVPADNPYVGMPGVLPEIWSSGLRNPWRFSFDAATGDLWIGDVGQNAVEEIDLVPAAQGAGRGTNFGWSAYEGTDRYNDDQEAPDHWPPIFEYRHSEGGCSVTGGVVYRGDAIPALRGAYVFSDFCAGGVRALTVQDAQLLDSAQLADEPGQVTSFGTDAAGEVYVLSQRGQIYRLVAA
jgi:glucose/arabinose dehydrogenase